MPSQPLLWYHMSKHDRALFASFILSEEGQQYDKLWFDYRLGNGHDPGPGYSNEQRNMVAALSMFRADVIAFKKGAATVIECKPYAGLAAYGQIQGYSELWRQRWMLYPSKVLVTDRPRPDLIFLCELSAIKMIFVEPATDQDIKLAESYTRPIIEELLR